MNLTIDIGNTSIKLGVFDGTEPTEVLIGAASLEPLLSKYSIAHAIISRTGAENEIEKRLGEKKIPFIVLSSQLKLPIEILYQSPETLGSDRIAGSVAATYLFPEYPILKIDFGTCITYDFVNEQRQYIGGAISPGMMMRFKALNQFTAKLPLVPLEKTSEIDLIGTDTSASIRSGVVHGIRQEVEGIIREYQERYKKLKVVSTGGDAPWFDALLKSEIFARPHLVLEGLNRILNYHL
ncbi:MAG: type III pantothenate kinase [Bacteroidetes bacterium]|nr:type III pantothenate kinase [Bacteroidota bacterium]